MIRIEPLKDQEIQSSVVKIVSETLPHSKITLFGSRANHTNRENSDYDIVIQCFKKIEAKVFYEIKERIDKLPTLKTIDLIDFHTLDHDFKEAVLNQGRVLHDRIAGETDKKIS